MLTLAKDTVVTRVIYQQGNVCLSDAFFTVFCSVETFPSEVCVSEIIVCVTSVKQFGY